MLTENLKPLPVPDLADLLPHKPPFVMVDALYDLSDTTVVAGLIIRPDNPLVWEGYFQESGVLEHAAQAVALKLGFQTRQQPETAAKSPAMGYLVGLRNVVMHNRVPVGGQIVTGITVTSDNGAFIQVQVRSTWNGLPVADCDMSLMVAES